MDRTTAQAPALPAVIKNFLAGILFGATISVIPLVVIYHRHLDLLLPDLNWQKKSFMAVCVVAAVAVHIYHHLFGRKGDKLRQVKLMHMLAIAYLFCYTTCAALCQKLALTTIALPWPAANADMNASLYSGADCPLVSGTGLLLVVVAAILQVRAAARKDGWMKTHLCPVDWSWLIFMAGVPLIFSVWLPLIAMPGGFIVLKWVGNSAPQSIIN